MSPPYRRLRDGDRVAVVAPAGPAAPEVVAQVPALFQRHGLAATLLESCHAARGFLAGEDELRLADLHRAFADPTFAAVFCLRGGYGSGRLLDRLDAGLIARSPKPLVGYSDITALHAWLARHELIGLHAPMPASDLVKPGHEADAAALFELLTRGLGAGTLWAPQLAPSPLRCAGVAEGRLVGGNLSLVAALAGTPWAWDARGAIVFLEDVSEEPYRVDRYLMQLRLAGMLDAAAGFLLGSFTEEASPDEVLAEYLLPLRKPLLAGWPAGHGRPNRPLPLAARVRLDATAGTLTVLDDVFV